ELERRDGPHAMTDVRAVLSEAERQQSRGEHEQRRLPEVVRQGGDHRPASALRATARLAPVARPGGLSSPVGASGRGRSAESITRYSAGALTFSSFSPSLSSALKIVSPLLKLVGRTSEIPFAASLAMQSALPAHRPLTPGVLSSGVNSSGKL